MRASILWVSCVIVTRHDIREAAWSVFPLCHLFLPNVICRLVKVGFFLFQQKLEEGDDVICVFLQRSGIAVGISQADLRSLLCQVSFDHRLTTFSWLPSCEYVILDWSKLKKPNVFVASTSGESLLTSLFAFWLISIRVNPWRAQPFAQIKFKSWKSWLICTILQFSAFESNNKGNNRYRKVRNCFGVAKTLIT